MSRVPILSRDDLALSDRDIFDEYERVRGVPPSVIHRAIANAPDLLRAYMPISNALRFETQLDARLRELAIVMVGYVTDSAYEVEAHTRFALQAGVLPEQLEAFDTFEIADVFDDRERAALRFAAEMTRTGQVHPATWAAVAQFFAPVEALELNLQVGFYNSVVRILGAFDLRPGVARGPAPSGAPSARSPMEEDVEATASELGEDLGGPLFGAMHEAPHLAQAYHHFGAGVLQGNGLEPGLRDLVAALVLGASGSQEMAWRHLQMARRQAPNDSRADAVGQFETASVFTDRERAVLGFAHESATRVAVGPARFSSLAPWFDASQFAALTILVAYFAGLARIDAALRVQQRMETL